MSRNVTFALSTVALIAMVVISGCSQPVSMNLQFSPNQTADYNLTTEVIKDFRFEQPNLGKLREEQSKTRIETGFSQTINTVDENGHAIAKITLNDLKIEIINKDQTVIVYDSQKGKSSPLSKLIGQSYIIRISPQGTVEAVEMIDLSKIGISGVEKKVAEGFLSEEAVVKRHTLSAMPQQASTVSVKDTWSQIVPSPPGLLAPKSYEKVYTLASVEENVALVTMAAEESTEQANGMLSSAGGVGIFANMFDNTDDYTGLMKVDLISGQVLKAEETLISTYTAMEMPPEGDPEKGPDTLTMTFTNRIQLKKLD